VRVLDLFCGAGGASEGLRQAGLEVVAAVDNWEPALVSHEANHPGAAHICADISELKPADLPEVDMVWASPPCVDFSTLTGDTDPQRGLKLVCSALDIIEVLKPRWWIIENVPNMRCHIQNYRSTEINAWQCGLPQHRRRLFVGEYPRPRLDPEPTATLGDIMDGEGANLVTLPVLRRRFCEATKTRWPIRLIGPDDLVPTIVTTSCQSQSRGDIMVIPEPGQLRWISELEVRRAQGFPDDYAILGNKKERLRQVGNAVAVAVARRIGEAIMEAEA